MALFFEHAGTQYMIGYIDGEAHPSNQEREINRLHTEKKRNCLEYIGEAGVLYRLLVNNK